MTNSLGFLHITYCEHNISYISYTSYISLYQKKKYNFEFWVTLKIVKPGITVEFLQNFENWPKGIKNTEVKPA